MVNIGSIHFGVKNNVIAVAGLGKPYLCGTTFLQYYASGSTVLSCSICLLKSLFCLALFACFKLSFLIHSVN